MACPDEVLAGFYDFLDEALTENLVAERKARAARLLMQLGVLAFTRHLTGALEGDAARAAADALVELPQTHATLVERFGGDDLGEAGRAALEAGLGPIRNQVKQGFLKLGRAVLDARREAGPGAEPDAEEVRHLLALFEEAARQRGT